MKSVLFLAFGIMFLGSTIATAAELIDVEGSAAEAVYNALTVEGEFDGGYHTTKIATGELTCVVRTPWGAPAFYWCELGSVLNVEEAAAEVLFEAFAVQGEFDGAYHTTKRAYGTLTCVVRTPWGAPASYFCTFAD